MNNRGRKRKIIAHYPKPDLDRNYHNYFQWYTTDYKDLPGRGWTMQESLGVIIISPSVASDLAATGYPDADGEFVPSSIDLSQASMPKSPIPLLTGELSVWPNMRFIETRPEPREKKLLMGLNGMMTYE